MRKASSSLAQGREGSRAAVKFGSLRNPGANLARLPVGLDLHTISIAEGIRAAVACGVLILANEWLHWPPLVYMALAANLTCFCDLGGPIRPRMAALLSFSILGGVMWGVFGLLSAAGLLIVLPLATLVFFCNAFARVWGQSAQTVGNLLSVVLIFALDRPLAWHEAPVVTAMFIAGGLWAIVLTLLLWRLHQYRPARESVAEVWRQLAALTGDLRRLAGRENLAIADWDDHARAHRRAVRIAIEGARGLVMDLVRTRGPISLRGSQALLRLEAGDQLFGALIALTELIDEAPPARRAAIHRLLRILQPLLLTLAVLIADDKTPDKARMGRVIARLEACAAGDASLEPLVEAIADRLRVAVRLSTPEGYAAGSGVADEDNASWRARVVTPVLGNLDWNSAMLRHALRTAAIAAPALAASLMWHGSFARWLPITVVLTIQPFYATTWQRAVERVAGTVLGGFIGAGLALLASTPAGAGRPPVPALRHRLLGAPGELRRLCRLPDAPARGAGRAAGSRVQLLGDRRDARPLYGDRRRRRGGGLPVALAELGAGAPASRAHRHRRRLWALRPCRAVADPGRGLCRRRRGVPAPGGRRQQQSGGLAHPRAAGAAARAAAAAGIGHGGRFHLAPPRRSPQHAAAWPWAGPGRRAGLLAGMA